MSGVIEDPNLLVTALAPDAVADAPSSPDAPWQVLVVDDETDVHAVLHLALDDVMVEGHRLLLRDALSAREARAALMANPDIALMLVDVVMESDQAGLELVRHVRGEMGNRSIQIVLITGQPGYAPQRAVVSGYEIDGYLLKSELSADRVFVSVYSGIRTYRLMREQQLLQRDLKDKVRELDETLQALRDSEANFITAQSVAHVGSWIYDLASDEMRLSAETCRIFGVPTGSIANYEAYLARVYPEDRDALEQAWRSVVDQCGSFEHEHRIMLGSGVRYVRQRADLTRAADGRPLCCLGTTQDITERKQAEAELQRSNAELEQFSYAISHDLRQPLRMISSYLQLLGLSLNEQLNAEQREYFNFAIDGARRLDRMLVALLEYSRAGRMGEPPAWVESRAILDEAMLFLQPAVAEAGATVSIRGTWPRIFVSPDKMLRVVQNLIANAAKFRVAGRVPEVVVSSELSGGDWCLSVADNGVGIAPGQLGRLFQVFQRLQSRVAFEGSGVGLALCRKIVEHHGGKIWAESSGEGHGSRFCVRLPLPDASA